MGGPDPVRKAHADGQRRSRARGSGRGVTVAAQTETGAAVDAMIAAAAVTPGTAAVAAAIFGTPGPERPDFTEAVSEPERQPEAEPEPDVDEIIRGARSATTSAAHERIFGPPPGADKTDTD